MEQKRKHKLDKRTGNHLLVMLFLSFCYYFYCVNYIFPEPFDEVIIPGGIRFGAMIILIIPCFMVLASMFISGVPYIFYAMYNDGKDMPGYYLILWMTWIALATWGVV
jgi:hypothetical protein